MYNEVANLCAVEIEQDEYGNENRVLSKCPVFVQPRSVGQREHYRAATTDFKPGLTLVLADYYDYYDEQIVEYHGKLYSVVRKFIKGTRLEIVLERRAGVWE